MFCRIECVPVVKESSRNLITRAAEACRRIADKTSNPDELTTDTIYAALGAESIHRVDPLIKYMSQRGDLNWDSSRVRALIQNERVAAILDSQQASPYAAILHQYRDHLALHTRMLSKQERALMTAIMLLSELKGAPLTELDECHVTNSLRHAVNRALLNDFLRFIAVQGGPRLSTRKSSTSFEIILNKKRQINPEAWRKRLDSPRCKVEAMALLVVLIASTSDLSVDRVLTLRREDVSVDQQRVILWPNSNPLILDPQIANAFRKWAAYRRSWLDPRGPWVFPGRPDTKPLSESTVYAHLNRKNI